VLYTAESATHLVEHLDKVRCSSSYPLDEAIDSIMRTGQDAGETAGVGYLVEPNLFRHVGFMSTIKGFSTHPEEFVI